MPGGFSLDGSLGEILGRFEKAVLQRLLGEYPSSRLLARRLGVSHTTIANKLRQHGLGRE
nr:TyrR/PhhR family helix-turn-helix DNA-binding protein [Azotobacter chroococcum]